MITTTHRHFYVTERGELAVPTRTDPARPRSFVLCDPIRAER